MTKDEFDAAVTAVPAPPGTEWIHSDLIFLALVQARVTQAEDTADRYVIVDLEWDGAALVHAGGYTEGRVCRWYVMAESADDTDTPLEGKRLHDTMRDSLDMAEKLGWRMGLLGWVWVAS